MLHAAAEPAIRRRLWTPTFAHIFVAYALLSLGLQMCNVLIGKYASSLGATPATVGLVASAFAISAIVFKCVSAPAIDSFDRRYVLMGALVALALAFAGYGLSHSIPPLLAFRLLQGAGQAFTATCCIAIAADTLPRERLGAGLGIFTLAPASAQMVGPWIALKVSATLGYDALFFLASAVVVVAVLVISRIRLPFVKTTRFRVSPRNILAKEVAIPATLLFFVFVCYSLVNAFLVIHATDRGVGTDIGLFFTAYAASLFVSRPLAGRLSDRFGPLVLVPFFGLFILAFFVIGAATTLPTFLVAAVLLAFGYGSCQPVLQAMAMKLVPSSRRGAASCTNFIGSDLGDFVGPVVGGVIAHTFGYQTMWQTMTISLLIAAVLVVVLRRRIVRGIEAPRPADELELEAA